MTTLNRVGDGQQFKVDFTRPNIEVDDPFCPVWLFCPVHDAKITLDASTPFAEIVEFVDEHRECHTLTSTDGTKSS